MHLPRFKRLYLTLIFSLLSINIMFGWGGWGHTHINRAAIFALPLEMRIFYYNHADFITEGAVIPDLRRGLLNDKPEPPRHFLDLENFDKNTLENMPRSMAGISKLYDSSFLQKNGILPWYIQFLMEKLTTAFKYKNKSDILFLSSELGHYIGDAHVPLHTTTNYDGQLTGQKGIHSFWESRIPETFGENYNFNTGEAKYIDNTAEDIFRIIKESNNLVPEVLSKQKTLIPTFEKEKLYKKDEKGQILKSYGQPVYSDEFTAAYNSAMNNMVENQMRKAVADLSNFWYTAWVNAGKPNLDSLDDVSLTSQNKRNYKKEIKLVKKGRLIRIKNKD